jgi:hypothetical protein
VIRCLPIVASRRRFAATRCRCSLVIALALSSCSSNDDASATDAAANGGDAAQASVDAAASSAQDAGGTAGQDAHAPDAAPDAAPSADAGPIDPPGLAMTVVLEDVWEEDALPTCEGDAECADGFSCLSGSTTAPPICAPACDTDAQCDAIELCLEGFGDGDDLCVALAPEKAFCGLPFRALCQADMTCLPLSNETFVGVCFQECDPTAAASGCEPPATCVPGWSTNDGAPSGACGVEIPRGEPCDAMPGDMVLCAPGDVCAPSTDAEAPWTCREACVPREPFDSCGSGRCHPFGRVGGAQVHACY